MTPIATLDVQCPNQRCGYVGPAPLIYVEETEIIAEHFAAVCPECARGWVLPLLERAC